MSAKVHEVQVRTCTCGRAIRVPLDNEADIQHLVQVHGAIFESRSRKKDGGTWFWEEFMVDDKTWLKQGTVLGKTKVSPNYQIVLIKELRPWIQAEPGESVQYRKLTDGTVIIEKVSEHAD
jgi:hypothetical protein